MSSPRVFAIELLYSDHEGGQRAIGRFALAPMSDAGPRRRRVAEIRYSGLVPRGSLTTSPYDRRQPHVRNELVGVGTLTATTEGGNAMLQITDTAASAFRDILAQDDVKGQAIRLVPERTSDGQGGISLEAIDEPAPADAQAEARGVRVVVAQELASTLDDAVLDAKPSEEGTEFFIRAQSASGSSIDGAGGAPCSPRPLPSMARPFTGTWCRRTRSAVNRSCSAVTDACLVRFRRRWTPPVCWCGAPVAQWIEHLTTDQKVGGSTPSRRAERPRLATWERPNRGRHVRSTERRSHIGCRDPAHPS